MRLGYYYHVHYCLKDGSLYLPEYAGRFVSELAKNVEELTCVGFTTQEESSEFDYCLSESNIEFVDLGQSKHFVELVLFGSLFLSKFQNQLKKCDVILVRAPSPLAPFFYFKFNNFCKLAYLFVGDYSVGVKHQSNPYIKQRLINLFTWIYERVQNRALRGSVLLANSPQLIKKYQGVCKFLSEVKTTTLLNTDIEYRSSSCESEIIKLLFVGRIERAKGVFDLLEVFNRINQTGILVELHLVGWNTIEKEDFSNNCQCSDFKNQIVFHGYKSGSELSRIFSDADIFVLPSYHEGFPRTIWEAMAKGLPVIVSNVGAVSSNLRNFEDAIIFEPGDLVGLENAILQCIGNKELRMSMIGNGYRLAGELTLEKQTPMLIESLNGLIQANT